MKQKFRDIHLSPANKKRLQLINEIIEDYQDQGYTLTLRQLYYQLVSRDVIPNQQKEYAVLSKLLKEGRMSGLVDWEAIEDRLRKPETPSSWNSPREIIDAVVSQYRRNRQENQEVYMEVWVEKDALSGIVERATEDYGIPVMVNRGYSSVSAMHDSFLRFLKAYHHDQEIQIIYLGDFDPSGKDMIRDIRERIFEFFDGSGIDDVRFEINPIALTSEQIKQYNPPPNPAKMTDPRAVGFVAAHGSLSWEVDALRPEILNELIITAIKKNLIEDIYNESLTQEEEERRKLNSLRDLL